MKNKKNEKEKTYSVDENRCFFCEENSPDKLASLNLPFYKEVIDETHNDTKLEVQTMEKRNHMVNYVTKEIYIPRCLTCKQIHDAQRNKRSRTTFWLSIGFSIFFFIFLFFVNPFVSIENNKRLFSLGFLELIGVFLVIFIFVSLITIPISSSIAKRREHKLYEERNIKPFHYFNFIDEMQSIWKNKFSLGKHPPK